MSIVAFVSSSSPIHPLNSIVVLGSLNLQMLQKWVQSFTFHDVNNKSLCCTNGTNSSVCQLFFNNKKEVGVVLWALLSKLCPCKRTFFCIHRLGVCMSVNLYFVVISLRTQ